jgi:hypothetical protein
MVAWLPREAMKDAPQDARRVRASRVDREIHPERTDIKDLREAIRANRVSFPSQVPTFVGYDRPDLQRQLAQLYFVLGWSCSDIGSRHGLTPGRVRRIVSAWKRGAVKALYIQYIPPAEVMTQQRNTTKPKAGVEIRMFRRVVDSESPLLSTMRSSSPTYKPRALEIVH